MQYPSTKKDNTIDTYFGKNIADPYRWLEDDRSVETANWVKEQNATTAQFLNQIPFRAKINDDLTAIWNYKKETRPFIEGAYTYYYKNNGLQNQNILFRKEVNGEEELFLDPNTFSRKGTDSLGFVKFSKDGTLCAYTISEGGSDWNKVIVLDTQDKSQIGDTLLDVKFSDIAWKGNEGFYYSTYRKPEGSKLSVKTDQHLLFFHKLNTAQKEDEIVFGAKENEKHRYVSGSISSDEKYLEIHGANATSGNRLFLKNLETDSDIIELTADELASSHIVESKNGKLYIFTNQNAPNNKLVVVDAENPHINNWTDLIAEAENVLDINKGGKYLFAQYIVDVKSKIFKYNYEGNLLSEVALPGSGSVHLFQAKTSETKIYYYFTNTITPLSIYCYDIESEKSILYWKPKINFKADNFVTKQVFYPSKDGTKIPMTISYKKGLDLDGKNPTIVYGYGGFGVDLLPSFSAVRATWMNLGGVFAVANLRGGGEYGKEWHDAGIKLKKQNVFDDFIAAAEYLIDEKYTDAKHLAAQGGSNGGLLVGAVMTQRPALFQVALPAVGVLDMLRYHTFTAGAGWAYDYGTSEQSKEMFEYILAYSPLHNVKEGTKYPSTMVTTGDHDDRVVPAHSFKFAAELQAKHQGENPVLIRVETDAGHGAGKPTSKVIAEYTDILSFSFYCMGVDAL